MSSLLYHVDLKWYNYKQADSLYVEGWVVAEDSAQVDFSVYDDSQDMLTCTVEYKERPDLRGALSVEKIPSRPGFILCVSQISSWLQKNPKYLEICASRGEECEVIVRVSVEEIRNLLADGMIFYHLDQQRFLGTTVELQGWFIDQMGNDKIQVIDEAGQCVPAEIKRRVRQDVTIQFPDYVEADAEIGFVIRIAKTALHTSHIQIVFESSYVKKELDIDLKQLQRTLTRSGRAYNILRPKKWSENRNYIKEHDLASFITYVKGEIAQGDGDYSKWVRGQQLSAAKIRAQRTASFSYAPKISIVIPLYKTPQKYLKKIVESIQKQTYKNWELCLADGSPDEEIKKYISVHYRRDARIRYKQLEKNGGISENTNAAVEMATGDFIMLSDHDDIVEQCALYEIVKALNINPQLDILYTDEDKITMDGKEYFEPHFKPDYNPVLLENNNYICHIFVVRREVMEKAGVFRSVFDGAQDYDFILRCCEHTSPERIYHIPQVLYHWRSHPNSTASDPGSKRYAYEAGAHALDEHFRRIGVDAKAEITENLGVYRIHRQVQGKPKVSIVIPNMDHTQDLERCLASIADKTTYENYEILVVENNSKDADTFAYYERMLQTYDRCRLLTWKNPFNYAAINNYAAGNARGEYLLFLNNDTELITENWIEELLGMCQQTNAGIVGTKLYYPDRTIQHAGIVIGMGGIAGHRYVGMPADTGKSMLPQNLSAVTAACMLISASLFLELHGFDEQFEVAYNDVDLCMKVTQAGYAVVYDPYVELYHWESKSRGSDQDGPERERLAREAHLFASKWPDVMEKGDPFYNINLSLEDGSCSLKY